MAGKLRRRRTRREPIHLSIAIKIPQRERTDQLVSITQLWVTRALVHRQRTFVILWMRATMQQERSGALSAAGNPELPAEEDNMTQPKPSRHHPL
jgi:hypothetical protein